ncbi:hypothetical protein Cgig2_026610 [Carnegiea gigantea]|uniref:Uncharacterized protein n=1 Tax=Carnegiea gigantea TaxID=171969 RepID=A0A9Q1QK07_9CARY|nr:hypothetical protein Cgig2_026610 [Carnegiea gigantea]
MLIVRVLVGVSTSVPPMASEANQKPVTRYTELFNLQERHHLGHSLEGRNSRGPRDATNGHAYPFLAKADSGIATLGLPDSFLCPSPHFFAPVIVHGERLIAYREGEKRKDQRSATSDSLAAPYDDLEAPKKSFWADDGEIAFVARKAGHAMCGGNISGMFEFFFTEPPVQNFEDAKKSEAAKFGRSEAGFTCLMHTVEDIQRTIAAAEKIPFQGNGSVCANNILRAILSCLGK